MSLFDAAGLVGVALILGAYAAAQLRVLDPTRPPALAVNLIGACLILLSLTAPSTSLRRSSRRPGP
jgi:peptidoglycan/LPS O-acetylase OafA/YrhL